VRFALNGKEAEANNGISVEEYLLQKGIELDKIVIEYNLEILKRIDWKSTVIKENDKLEVLRFVGGG